MQGLTSLQIAKLDSITFKKGGTKAGKENCAICLDACNAAVKLKRLPCKHVFHTQCISRVSFSPSYYFGSPPPPTASLLPPLSSPSYFVSQPPLHCLSLCIVYINAACLWLNQSQDLVPDTEMG